MWSKPSVSPEFFHLLTFVFLQVTGLQPDSFYFFRLKAVHKNGKQGQPGPVAREKTACGKPTQPPQNIKVSAVDFNGVKVTWDPPAQKTWKCGHVSLTLKFQNDTTNTAQVKLFSPAEKGIQVFEAQPSSTWTIQMRTEAIEDGRVEPGDWSDEKFVTVPSGIPGTTAEALQFLLILLKWLTFRRHFHGTPTCRSGQAGSDMGTAG